MVLKVGFLGKLGSGKTTCANYCSTRLGKGVTFKFASPLYRFVADIYGNDGQKHRAIMQGVADAVRKEDPLVFVKRLERDLEDYGWVANVYIDDVRFANEALMLKQHGFTLIKLVRNDNLRLSYLAGGSATHSSETEVDDCVYDYMVENNGSFEELYEKLDYIVGKINKYFE